MSEVHKPVVLFPAIDLRNGQCVRLEQGLADRQTVYRSDPLVQAAEFVEQGATWIHVVDLDAAFGQGSNRGLIERIASESGAQIQTGGGIRSEADLEEVLGGSAARAVIGTAAVENPDMVRRAIERWGATRIVVGLDARGRKPAVRGWTEDSKEDLFDLGGRLAEEGVTTFLYTDISRDGMLQGPNLETSVSLARGTGASVLVSGGVGTLADLIAVRDANREAGGIAGVVVGKAIYEGKFGVNDGIRALSD